MGPSPDDVVDLCFVTPTNFIWYLGATRKRASEVMRSWYYARDQVAKNTPEAMESREWLMYGTFATNNGYGDREWVEGDETWCAATVAWSAVIGMYIRERDPLFARRAALERRQLEYAERQLDELESGDKWKKGREEPE